MKILFLLLSLLSLLMPANAQNKRALAKSDSLFARGVDLYKADQYEDAIPLFQESDLIDKTELDSTSNRRDYSAMWLASCYYKLGKEAEAKAISKDYYGIEPVDRRLTVTSDSLSTIGVSLALEGDYENAISYLLSCAELEKKTLNEEHIWYINTLSTLIDCNIAINNYRGALEQEKVLLTILEKSVGKMNVQYISLLGKIAETLTNLGEYEQAIMRNKEALNLLQKIEIPVDDWKVYILIGLADCYNYLNNYPQAINAAMEAVHISSDLYGKNHSEYANVLARVAIYKGELGKFDEAIELALTSKDILFDTLGEYHTDYISLLDNLSTYYMGLGEYNKALDLSHEALDKTKHTEGKNTYGYAAVLLHYANCCAKLGKLKEAIDCSEKVVTIFESLYGKDHPFYASSVSNLANCYAMIGDYSKAIELSNDILNITKERYGTENVSYAVGLSNLASFYSGKRNNLKAIELGEEALIIKERLIGKEHPIYINSLQSLATYYSDIGKYEKGYEFISEALRIGEKIYNKELAYTDLLKDCAIYYSDVGDYEKAINLIKNAMEMKKTIARINNPAYISMLSVLGGCYAGLGNHVEAIKLYSEALEISDSVYGFAPLKQVGLITNLAILTMRIGRYEIAFNWAKIALDIMKNNQDNMDVYNWIMLIRVALKCVGHLERSSLQLAVESNEYSLDLVRDVLGVEHPLYVSLLSDFSFFYAELKDYDKAIEYGEKVLQYERNSNREELPTYVDYQKLQAIYCLDIGDGLSVSEHTIGATDKILKMVENNFQYLTSYERILFLEKYQQWLKYKVPEIAYCFPTDSLLATAFNSVLFGKGILLHTDLEMRNIIIESKDSVLTDLYDRIAANHAELDKLYSQRDTTLYSLIDSLEAHVQDLERILIFESKEYGCYTENLKIRWQDVRQRLGGRDLALEFLKFPVKDGRVMYAALALKQGMPFPKMFSLFSEEQLKKISITDYYTTSLLSRLVWESLKTELHNVENVYFAPEGELYNIAIESLPDWEGAGLMSDKWNFFRLSSTRELALVKEKNEIRTAAVYGGLIYDTDEDMLVNDSKKYPKKRDLDIQFCAIVDSLNLRDGVEELPATKTEAVNIDRVLTDVKVKDLLYTGTAGTESSFKSLSGQKRNLLHIATHGFYWKESDAKLFDRLNFISLDNDNLPLYVEDKAMTRSGLLFAGANHALKGKVLPEGVDDGILTAKEISTLDLRGLDMVVLSACQTGLGEISGDGVFGLQRGFKKAGANTLLMSLWKVDDNATQMLMTQFYANLTSGKSKFESLREAQRYVREYEVEVMESDDDLTPYQRYQERKENDRLDVQLTIRKIKPYASPKYWAAFILLDAIN